MHSEAQNWSGGRVSVLAAQPTSAERTRRPFITRYLHPQWPETAILAEIRGNNREKRLLDGRESLSRRPQPPGCTTRPQKTGSRDSTIISLALHTMPERSLLPHGSSHTRPPRPRRATVRRQPPLPRARSLVDRRRLPAASRPRLGHVPERSDKRDIGFARAANASRARGSISRAPRRRGA